jgi:hypothetical protein
VSAAVVKQRLKLATGSQKLLDHRFDARTR